MSYYLESILYLVTCLLPFWLGLKNYALLDKALRIFVLITGITFFGELIALYAAVVYKNNLPVYNIMKLFIVVLICLYFNYCIDSFRKYRVGIIMSSLSALMWVVTVFFVHSITQINSTYMAYEGIITIAMSVYSMEFIISQRLHRSFRLLYSYHFWIACILLVYWCFSIVQWVLYTFFTSKTEGFPYLELSLTIISMLINIGFAVIFFFYPKMKQLNVT